MTIDVSFVLLTDDLLSSVGTGEVLSIVLLLAVVSLPGSSTPISVQVTIGAGTIVIVEAFLWFVLVSIEYFPSVLFGVLDFSVRNTELVTVLGGGDERVL